MKNRFKSISLLCGTALILLAAFPIFAQTDSDMEINKKPLQDFGEMLSERVQKKEVVLTENFLVEIEGELTPAGKFDLQKTKYVRTEGDAKMADVAKSAIEAINDSGVFIYLKRLDVIKVNLILAQDDEQIYMSLKSDFVSENKAKTALSGMNMAVSMGKMQTEDADTKTILGGTSVSSSGKSAIIKTVIPKSVWQEMIERQLNKESEPKQKAANE